MSGVATRTADRTRGAVPTEPSGLGPRDRRALKRAQKGDASCLPEVRALLADPDDRAGLSGGLRFVGRVAPRNIIAKRRSGKTFSAERPFGQELDGLRGRSWRDPTRRR